MKILSIEDNVIDQEVIRRALQGLYELREAEDGSKALQILSKETYDCILLDNLLPDTTGLELLPKIREMGVKSPVVVVTGFGSETIAVQAMKDGAQDYIPKDQISAELLVRVIQNAIKLSQKEIGQAKIAEKYMNSLKEIQEKADTLAKTT